MGMQSTSTASTLKGHRLPNSALVKRVFTLLEGDSAGAARAVGFVAIGIDWQPTVANKINPKLKKSFC
jgi:hypothetical protein